MNGFSADGYIIDQNCFSDYPYRGMSSDINGCGWIAAYNFRHALGQTADFEEVLRDMNAMFPLQIPGPTPVRALRRYLKRHAAFDFAAGRRAALAAAEKCPAGILRYWEGDVPHFVCFVRAEGPVFRFFNVADGQEDVTAAMDAFFAARVRRGYIRAIAGK